MDFTFKIEDWIHKRWAWHLLLLLTYYSVSMIGYTVTSSLNPWSEFLYFIFQSSLQIGSIYTAAWFLLPQFLYKKKFIAYVIGLLVLTYLFSLIDFKTFTYVFREDISKIGEAFFPNSEIQLSNFYFFLILFGSALKFAKDTILKEYDRQQIEKQRLIQEANFLRSQLSAHFLLNSMNNLYGLSVTKDERLPNLMLQLSELLQYSLYDTKDDVVSLKSEIDYLNNYIELMKIRLSAKVDLQIKLDCTGSQEHQIAPMILSTYIENAFKYCYKNAYNEYFIHLNKFIKNDILYLEIKNSFNENDVQNSIENQRRKTPKGVGLENAKRRLELLYADRHELKINHQNGVYEVMLKIVL